VTYFHYLAKKHFSAYLISFAFFVWGLSSTVYALKQKSEMVLIGLDSNGTRIISSQEDPLFKTEVVNFVRRFFSVLYNFDAESFDENVGAATDLMSQDLWQAEKDKITRLREYVKSESVSYSGAIQTITKTKDSKFQILLRTSELHRLKSKNEEIVITISLKPSVRTKSNPWGMEVVSLEEGKL
jgi:hypothetical protein